MFLGPDCRIYVSPASTAEMMHVIHHPNRKGKDCGFEVDAITMPTRLAFSVPNIMTFRTTAGRQLCDSTKGFLSTSVTDVFYDWDRISLTPNPASDHFVLNLPDHNGEEWVLHLISTQGTILKQQTIRQGNNVIGTKDFPQGLYTVSLYRDGIPMLARRLVLIGD
jgi:hypothetical protein